MGGPPIAQPPPPPVRALVQVLHARYKNIGTSASSSANRLTPELGCFDRLIGARFMHNMHKNWHRKLRDFACFHITRTCLPRDVLNPPATTFVADIAWQTLVGWCRHCQNCFRACDYTSPGGAGEKPNVGTLAVVTGCEERGLGFRTVLSCRRLILILLFLDFRGGSDDIRVGHHHGSFMWTSRIIPSKVCSVSYPCDSQCRSTTKTTRELRCCSAMATTTFCARGF